MTVSRKPLEASGARLGSLARLPVFLSLDGKRAVLAGGTSAAAWKAELLSASGAWVPLRGRSYSSNTRFAEKKRPIRRQI